MTQETPETEAVSKKNDPKDRRIRKTRAALKESLTSLLKTKPIREITVRELTELADVNRGTFYLHYRDVFDLLAQSEDDLLKELHELIARYDTEELHKDPAMAFEGIYKLCQENSDIVRILIGENGDIQFLDHLKRLVREKCLSDWSFLLQKQQMAYFDAYYAFFVGGCISLLQYWFQDGMRETPRELANITAELLENGLRKHD